MGTKRKHHSAEFKAKVAMEALKGLKTQSELAAEHEVHPVQISGWKSLLVENCSQLFTDKRATPKQDHEAEKALLFEKIGRLEMENDWLKKKLEKLP